MTTTADVPKAGFIGWVKERVPQVMADAAEVNSTNLSGQLLIQVKTSGAIYKLDTSDTTTADDGLTCLISYDGFRFKIVSSGTAAIRPSIEDFGAVEGGTQDCISALTAAFTSLNEVWVTKGTWRLDSNFTVASGKILNCDWGAVFTGTGKIIPAYGRVTDHGSGGIQSDTSSGGIGPQRNIDFGTDQKYQFLASIPSSFETLNLSLNTTLFANSRGNGGAITGAAFQNGASSGFPTGICGYGRLEYAGNAVFGIFGRADAYTSGGATNELNSFNYSGSAPADSWPYDNTLGSTNSNTIALVVAAGGDYPCLAGIVIAQEGGDPQPFLTGIYSWPNATTKYGIFIDASTTEGPVRAALIRGTGLSGTYPLQVQVMNYNAARPLIQGLDPSGVVKFQVNHNGDVTMGGGLALGGVGGATVITVNGSTSGSLQWQFPAVLGTSVVKWPAGSVDFTATGGSSQVVKQTSAGGPFTVGQLSSSDISGLGTAATNNTGTSGNVVPLLDASNTFSGNQFLVNGSGEAFISVDGSTYSGLRMKRGGVAKWDLANDQSSDAFYLYNQSSVVLSIAFSDGTITTKKIKYTGANTTGAGSALLGANSPAGTLSAPYTWFTMIASDGSTVYVPAWK